MGSVTISEEEYAELKRKAEAYDNIRSNNSKAGKTSVSKMTPEQLSARAKKAVKARIKKYNQARKDKNGK